MYASDANDRMHAAVKHALPSSSVHHRVYAPYCQYSLKPAGVAQLVLRKPIHVHTHDIASTYMTMHENIQQ